MEVGKVINDRYSIKRKLPSGPSNHIYIAEDTHMNQTVIVKTFGSSKVWEKILANRVSLLRMSSDYIPKVLEVDEFDGEYCIVEEFIEGKQLSSFLADNELSLKDILGIFDTLLDALDSMHHLKLVHADVKPQNIFIKDDGTKKIGVLIDIDSAFMHQTRKNFFGSLSYAAPEQIIDNVYLPPVDIYALAMVVFYMIERRLPFRRDKEGLQDKVNGSNRIKLDKVQDTYLKEKLESLLASMTALSPGERPSILQIKRQLKNVERWMTKNPNSNVLSSQTVNEDREYKKIDMTLDVTVMGQISVNEKQTEEKDNKTTVYGMKLMDEYDKLNKQAAVAFRLWVATFVMGLIIVGVAVVLIIMGKYCEALLTSVLEALLYFAQKCFAMREDYYREQNDNKLKHLETGDYFELALRTLDSTDVNFRNEKLRVLLDALVKRIQRDDSEKVTS